MNDPPKGGGKASKKSREDEQDLGAQMDVQQVHPPLDG